MLDEEVIECVALAAGGTTDGATIEPLGGKQGLLVCRVALPGRGSFVFKAVRASGRRELLLTDHLSRLAPSLVPQVLAYEEDAHRDLYWLITRDVGGARLADSPSTEGYIAVAEALAAVQTAAIEEEANLQAIGLPQVTGERWEDVALAVLEAAERCDILPLADHSGIEKMAWKTGEVARDTLSFPVGVIHGDLHAGNVALTPLDRGTPVCLLDWGSAYLAPAPIAIEELLWPAARHLRLPEQSARVRAAYYRSMAPLLGKPGRIERQTAACRILFRLLLLRDALTGNLPPGPAGAFGAVSIARGLCDAWRAWEKAG